MPGKALPKLGSGSLGRLRSFPGPDQVWGLLLGSETPEATEVLLLEETHGRPGLRLPRPLARSPGSQHWDVMVMKELEVLVPLGLKSHQLRAPLV